jgi:ribosomal-protein-serine acetyltransferase
MPHRYSPILMNLPDHLETEQLLLRAPQAGDGEAVHQAIVESAATLRPWMTWANPLPSRDQTESSVRHAAVQFLKREALRFHIYRKTDDLFLGSTTLQNIDWSIPRFEIGYWLRVSVEGQGYMTEAVSILTRFTFGTLGAQRVEIRCDARNRPSIDVAQRVGYKLEGRLRRERRDAKGNLSDTLIFARIVSDAHQ